MKCLACNDHFARQKLHGFCLKCLSSLPESLLHDIADADPESMAYAEIITSCMDMLDPEFVNSARFTLLDEIENGFGPIMAIWVWKAVHRHPHVGYASWLAVHEEEKLAPWINRNVELPNHWIIDVTAGEPIVYLCCERSEAEIAQSYWAEKRKGHEIRLFGENRLISKKRIPKRPRNIQ
jgi:hypothetical protein